MPTLHVLAGPNGAGKTSFYSFAVLSGFISTELPFVNVDIITKELGGYTEENYVRASEIYRQQVSALIEADSDFMIESNLADDRSYQWLMLVGRKGYQIVLYYLSTKDVAANISRVQRRVAEGGHNIPEGIVRSRYAQSHSYLKTKLTLFKEVYLIDNSTSLPQVQLSILDGVITQRSPKVLDWVKEIISIYKRLQGKTLDK